MLRSLVGSEMCIRDRKEAAFNLPKGKWEVLADQDKAGIKVLRIVKRVITVPASTGLILKKK